jgi:hypothetical protein
MSAQTVGRKKQIDMARNSDLMHGFGDENGSFLTKKFLIASAIVLLLGAGTGFLLARSSSTSPISKAIKSNLPGGAEKGKIYGSDDIKTYKDTAEGVLEEGGLDGEGQYHLVRPGGESQYVYMTSSTVDLSQFNKRKIKVWGATQAAQKVGWLMDVGRVQVLE